MEVVNIISILWFVGSIACCIGGCHRSRVLGRKIRSLEDKLEKITSPPASIAFRSLQTHMQLLLLLKCITLLICPFKIFIGLIERNVPWMRM